MPSNNYFNASDSPVQKCRRLRIGQGDNKWRSADRPQMFTAPQKIDMCKQVAYTHVTHKKQVFVDTNFTKQTLQSAKESPAASAAEARRRRMARKKEQDEQTRALRLHLNKPKFNTGRENTKKTDTSHLQELYELPPSETIGIQTEFEPYLLSKVIVGKSNDKDVSTQVNEKDLFHFETDVRPIAESLVDQIFRQSVREVLYEQELNVRDRRQRALHLRHTIERIDTKRLEQEDKRLNKVLAEHTRLFDKREKKVKARLAAAELTASSVSSLLPEVLSDLNQNELNDGSKFVSWLMDELKADETKDFDSDEILTSMIRDLVENRLESYENAVGEFGLMTDDFTNV